MWKLPKNELSAVVRQTLDQLDMSEKLGELTKNLSGGQKRKLSVAMAMVGNPKILFLE
jgi:ABC-type multidrug transport system ATPase subunit